MSAENRITLRSIGGWLGQGWDYYRQNPLVSSAYIALFLVPGIIMQMTMMLHGYGLLYYLFAGGFLILSPVLSALYYPLSALSDKGEQASIGDFIGVLSRVPKSCWVLTVLMIVLYLIWITDALIIYSFYFKLEPVYLSDYLANPAYRTEVNSFALNISIAGLVIAIIGSCTTVFSLPHAFEARAGFVDSVAFSIKAIFRHFIVILAWGITLSLSQLAALLIFSPLEIVLLPVLAYANLAAYRQIRDYAAND